MDLSPMQANNALNLSKGATLIVDDNLNRCGEISDANNERWILTSYPSTF